MAGTAAGVTSGVIMGGFLCIGLFFLAIVGTIIISLISVYTSNNSVEGYGDEYRLDSMMLKSLYSNSSCVANTVTNGSVSANSELSDLCTTQFSNTGDSNTAGCVVDNNNVGYGSCNESTTVRRRRRATVYAALYTIGRARLFYSTTCGRPGDKSKYSNASSLSNCVKKRIAVCNSIFGTSTTLQEWGPPSSSIAFTINNIIIIPMVRIFGVPRNLAPNWLQHYGGSANTRSQLSAGCQYIGPISHSAIAAAIASQSATTTTVASTASG